MEQNTDDERESLETHAVKKINMIFVVYGWNQYYPPANGIIEVHEDRESAEEVRDELQQGSENLPYEHYDIAEKELQ